MSYEEHSYCQPQTRILILGCRLHHGNICGTPSLTTTLVIQSYSNVYLGYYERRYPVTTPSKVLELVQVANKSRDIFEGMMESTNLNFTKITDITSIVDQLMATNHSIVEYIEKIDMEAKKLLEMGKE